MSDSRTLSDRKVEQPTISTRVKPTIEVDGLTFRDLDGDGQLAPYEDWRLSAQERARDLVGRMTLEEKTGLMLIDTVNAAWEGTLTEVAHDYLKKQHMRRTVFRNTVDAPGQEVRGDDTHPFIAGRRSRPSRPLRS